MTHQHLVYPDALRTRLAAALSALYRREVPDYGTLLSLVEMVNAEALARDDELARQLAATGEAARLPGERHGAIRVGTAAELAGMKRLFAGYGMRPVGYYDLGVAGIPVHSTAFRATDTAALAASPFRVFCSLLRTELIADNALADAARAALAGRSIFHGDALRLADKAPDGLTEDEAERFVTDTLETFCWRERALVSHDLYTRLAREHRLIADVASFAGPHINHLTPRTLDIDAVQSRMAGAGVVPKAVVEGPPARRVPILLRQTAFKAVEEAVVFPSTNGDVPGRHTARFGEVEQRGAALTPKGRALYDRLLGDARATVTPAPDGSNARDYETVLASAFSAFADDADTLRRDGLAYFHYGLADGTLVARADLQAAIADGRVTATPLTYEDFLPVSAAGIFQSNLGDDVREVSGDDARAAFEAALGEAPLDPFALYARNEAESLTACVAS